VSSDAQLQCSGAVRDDATLADALLTGASRIVVDPSDLEWASAAVSTHGDLQAVGLDIRQPEVFDVAGRLDRAGCRRFVVTDKVETHHWKHGDRHLLEELRSSTNSAVMDRGGIRHLNDLHELVPPTGSTGSSWTTRCTTEGSP